MAAAAYLSPKLPQLARQGWLLCGNDQPGYDSRWHLHDCAMLLWPQAGELRTSWLADARRPGEEAGTRLARGSALLLPAHAQHRTRGQTPSQRHGELYLSHELLGAWERPAVLRLDGAAVAMLDALASPALRAQSAEPLVRAIVRQCSAAPRGSADLARESLVQQLLRRIAAALEREEGAPTIRQVARDLGVSPRTLERHCEAEGTASPVALRRALLAGHARVLLRQGHTLAQVSRRLDFATSGHLSRLLRDVPQPGSCDRPAATRLG